MLNEISLGAILKVKLPQLMIEDVHWRTQDSMETSLLFYKIGDDKASQRLFAERVGRARFAWLIVNRSDVNLPANSTVMNEEHWPDIQKRCLDQLYPLPPIKLLAITGTNGKTTTADLVLQLGEMMGKKGMSIGTLGVRENQKTLLGFGLTSPCLIDLRKFLFTYGKNKDFCVMEVSSHALVQGRLHGIMFDGGGWLSFSQDHLDYHGNMETYFDSKCLLIDHLKAAASVFVPAEQEELFEKLRKRSALFLKASEIREALPAFFQTRFNRNNLEVAVSLLAHVFKEKVPSCWHKIVPPDGRFFILPFRSNYIVVDFAHTPDALENICKAIKEAFPSHKLKILFGCGGDRDKNKRPQMGSVAEKWADYVYLTSDNPRSEDPAQIIEDIARGMRRGALIKIIERPAAAQLAFSELKDNEILLLAGKGHEDYILINDVKHPYSDIKEVEQFIARNLS